MNSNNAKRELAHFFGNDDLLLSALSAAAIPLTFQAESTIINMADTKDDLYYIYKGQAKAVIYSKKGHEIWVDDLKPYTFIGEIAALTGSARTSDIIAVTEIEALSFKAASFLKLMSKYGDLGLTISRLLAQRIKSTTRQMFEMSAFSAKGRIYSELLRLANKNENGMVFIYPVPAFTKIAERISTTRETVSRTVSELESHGFIKRENDKLFVITPQNLEE